MRLPCALCLPLLAAVYFGACLDSQKAAAQPAAPAVGEQDEELARQKQIIDRFITVLERNPRRGTALDKIYGFHVENGTVEAFAAQLRERVAAKTDDGVGWMVLGLVESQRGRDAAAVEALTKAKELRPDDALAAYYLGQALVLVGQPEKAVTVFEEAIQRKPAQTDLLEIFQALGRVHQRAQRTVEALEVWNRLEKLFPGDARVQEQIAVTLVEEGQSAAALPRYEQLAKTTTDDYRRTAYRIEAAELKVKLSRASEGIADLEQLAARLNPESWLFREVRRKIEEVFLRTDDQDGLAKYYTAWLAKNADDIEAMARLARVLARQARVPEATEWLNKALKLAPSRKELRLAFIEQLVDDQRYAEAIQQYAELDKADPNNPDYLREWGKLILRDSSRGKEERQAQAEKTWQRLLAARPADPLIATQVADLFRNAEMQPQALALYQKAVELAPASPQYREYLGEYYHILQRPDEALATWRKMAEGEQRTATNVARLAEVLVQFGYLQQALPEIAAACMLDPKDFSLALKAADFEIRAEQYETALASLARAENLAQNDEEREAVLGQQIKTYTLQNKLSALAAELARQTGAGSATQRQWFLLARYREALHEYPEATKAITEALTLAPTEIPSLASAARIAEQSGDLKTAADMNRKLAVVDRRGKTDYLQHVAGLEAQLGRVDESLAAGRELIAASPGNIEAYQFFADLCFRLGKTDDGLAALRRATRVNPNEQGLLLALGAALATQFRTDEAIEIYWQAFDKGKEIDDKLSVINKLAELYLQINHFDQLLERLARGRREADQRREMTICLAQAYQSAGDYGMARQELERLLSENTRDTTLLLQLSKLAESESDVVSAVKYQEQLAKLAPGAESEYRLATLLSRAGDNQEAAAILVRLAAKEEDKEKLLRNIDSLLANQQEETALALIEPKLRENPNDWEVIYRQGVALGKRTGSEAAARSFQSILDLSLADDELSTAAKNRQKNPKTRSTQPIGRIRPQNWRLDSAWQIRRAIGLDYQPYYVSNPSQASIWTPSDFGLARMAAAGWLYRFAELNNTAEEFAARRRERVDSPSATPRELWDWVYLQGVRQTHDGVLAAARRLCQQGGAPEKQLYLMKLATRSGDDSVYYGRPGGDDKEDKTPPLPAEELALALRTFDEIRRMAPDPNSDVNYYANAAAYTILQELRRAGRQEDERKLYDEIIGRASSLEGLSAAMRLAVQRRDRATFLSLYERFAAKDLQSTDPRSNANAMWRQTMLQQIGQYIGEPDATPDDIAQTLDRFLSHHASKTNQRRNSPTYRPSIRSPVGQQNNYVFVWRGNGQHHVPLAFPAPSDYFDREALGIVRGAFEYFRGKDLTSDLAQHLQASAAKTPAADRLFFLLARAYIEVWNEDRESAATTFSQAAALVPQDLDLKLEVAQLHIEMKQLDEALAQVDSIAPLDQRTMQRREAMGLDLAVRLGDHARARDAAQRLFGLRLDAETQVTLAGQMRRLGMNEEAEAVLARAQRQAGSRISALAALMGQYQAQGNMELAAQVAHQILRRSRTAPAAQAAMGYYNADSQSRTAALACLAQAGKVKELIAALEEQIKRAPQATQLYETLGEYYQAAGETQKMLELHAKIISLRPDDADLRFRYAQELYRNGKASEACDEYLVVFKKQPRIMTNRYWEVVQAFQRARKETELARTLSEINLKSFGQPYMVTNLIANLMQNQRSRAAGMVLFKKAWESFPEERSELMSNFDDAATWKLPEVIDYAKKSLLPTDEAVRNNPWYGLYGGISFEGEGQIKSALHRLLDAMAGANQLTKLRAEVAAAVVEHPNWRGGPVILAIIDLRQGKQLDAAAVIQPLVEAPGNDYELLYARWIIAQEIEKRPGQRGLAIKLLERASRPDEQDSMDQFDMTPAHALVRLYVESGERNEARKLLLKAARSETPRDGNYWYRIGQRIQSLLEIGKLLEEIEQPVDALKVYRELLIKPDFREPSIRNYTGRAPEEFQRQAREAIGGLIKRFAERPTTAIAEALLTPSEKLPSGATAVIDLMIATAQAAGSPLPLLDSPFSSLIRPAGVGPEAAGKIEATLVRLGRECPSDLSVHTAAALFALKGNDAAKSRAAMESLNRLVEAAPLEALAAGKRANARQRADAAPQIGLWLVARECAKQADLQALAEPLAQRAIAAAQRQLEPAELTAILYERGRLALEGKDSAAAEKLWSELIELALVQPRLPRAGAAEAAQRAARIPATLSQFKLGAAIAQAAAEHDLVGLSLRAIRETLSGGVPVADLPEASAPPVPVFRSPQAIAANRGDIDATVFKELSSRMWQLSQAWKRRSFPPDQVCQLLEEMVFPAGRPGDVLIYEQPAGGDLRSARSLGRLLVEWALRADRVAELERQIAARQSSPTDIVSGQVLLVQLGALTHDEARTRDHLQALAKQLEGSKLASLSELAAHAAAATLDDPRLLAAAAPLLEKLVTAASPEGHYPSHPEPHSAITILTRHYLKAGDAAAASVQVDRYLQSRQQFYARFGGGDAGLDFQRSDLAWGASELARGGDVTTTLAAIGRFADVTVRREGHAPVDVALWHLSRQMRKLPPQERYERLRDWTLPTADRRSVRFALGWDSGQPIPETFFGPSPPAYATYEPQPRQALLCNLSVLVESAAEASRLDELAALVEPLATEKTPGAQTLAILTFLARRQHGAVASRLEAIARRVKEATPSANPQNRGDEERQSAQWEDYVVVRAALMDDEVEAPAKRLAQLLITQARRTTQPDMVASLVYDLARCSAKSLAASDRQQVAAPLKHWTAYQAPQPGDGSQLPPALWTVHDGHLVHRGNGLPDYLYFKYPLTGEFEFSYDLFVSADSLLEIGYDGLTLTSQQPGGRLTILAGNLGDQVNRPPPLENRNGWNRIAVRLKPGRVQYLINGHVAYQDRSPGSASPWLVLGGSSAWPVMKNVRLTGSPTIPREIKLINGERLDGWTAQFYGERLPARLQKDTQPSDAALDEASIAGEDEAIDGSGEHPIDWRVENGVLEGRLDSIASSRAPSLIEYQRPLDDGQRVAYQFLYEPGKTHVHPAFGRIAFLLEPAGLKPHWMTSESDENDALLLDPRNVASEPSSRRGPAELPLKAGDWNDIEVAFNGGEVTIRLNGQLICQRPIESTAGRQFGLFHDKGQTAAKIRNLKLRGNWPESLVPAERDDLLALTSADLAPALHRARHGLVGEQHLATAAYDVWKQSLELDPHERYEFLKRWVLPGDSHPTIRLQGDWTPVDPPQEAGSAGSNRRRGGELISPAQALVSVAKELNKLDELASAIALAANEYPDQARLLNSLEALVAVARGDAKTVVDRLTKGIDLVKEQAAETPLHERYGEYLAAYAALALPAARTAARTLAQEITNDQRPPRAVDAEWSRRTPRLRAIATWATDPVTRDLPFGGGFTLKEWLPVARPTAKDRGEGFGPAAWKVTPGEVTYMTGSEGDSLYYAVPLKGDFEVRGQITTAGNRMVRLVYGGIGLSLSADGTTLIKHEVGRTAPTRLPIIEKINGWGPNVEAQLTVTDSSLKFSVNGQQLHNELLARDADPWLAIETGSPNHTGMVRGLQIQGTPVVPREIPLARGAGLEGWSAEYYGELIGSDRNRQNQPRQKAAWLKKGEEIAAGKFPNAPGSFRESVLQYHRPLAEDGQVEYEFFYEPGKTEVHPAIDRMVFLLGAKETKLHWLTDAQYDRSGLLPDNSENLPGAKPAKLKPNDWNKVRLELRGDDVAVFVNGEEAARHPLDPTNQRIFGFFRYSDLAAVRIRNIVHRGNWPTIVPPVEKQELATAPPPARNAAKGKAKAKAKAKTN